MLTRKREVFAPTDGVLYVGTDPTERSARGADYSDPNLIDTLYPLAYRRMRISARDVELADATGSELTAKVEVRHAFGLTADDDVSLGGRVYEVTRVEDRGRTCWMWLSEIATDGTCELLPEGSALDSHGIPVEDGSTPVVVHCRRVAHASKRTVPVGVDQLRPSLTLRVRALDYCGETRLRRMGITYTVVDVQGAGRWVDLVCERKVADA